MLQVSTKCKELKQTVILQPKLPPPPPPPLKQTTFSAENINLNNNCDFLACEIVLQAKISISVTVYHFNKE